MQKTTKQFGSLLAVWGLLLTLALVGCQAKAVNETSGQVINAGQPVKLGLIRFTPMLEKGNDGPTVTVTVKDGKFTTIGATAPISPGPNMARIEVVPEGSGERNSDYFEVVVDIPEGGKTDLVLDTADGKKVR